GFMTPRACLPAQPVLFLSSLSSFCPVRNGGAFFFWLRELPDQILLRRSVAELAPRDDRLNGLLDIPGFSVNLICFLRRNSASDNIGHDGHQHIPEFARIGYASPIQNRKIAFGAHDAIPSRRPLSQTLMSITR